MGGKAYQTDTNGNIVEVGTQLKKSSLQRLNHLVDLLYNTTDNEFHVSMVTFVLIMIKVWLSLAFQYR